MIASKPSPDLDMLLALPAVALCEALGLDRVATAKCWWTWGGCAGVVRFGRMAVHRPRVASVLTVGPRVAVARWWIDR
jgi:hypothetical protein